MNYIYTILISSIISITSVLGFYNYIPINPIKLLQTGGEQMLGTSITTIQGTDTLKNSRTTINDNFDALNAGKIEISTTTLPLIGTLNGLTSAGSLATVGTIGTGVWNATALTVAYGGTGSTTLSSNQVLLGNGTGILKTVAGFGTSGQFLTSTGAGTAPTWQTSTLALGDDYAWTGEHSFTGDTSLASTTFNASTTWDILPEYDSDPIGDDEAVRKSYLQTYIDSVSEIVISDDVLRFSSDSEIGTSSSSYVKIREFSAWADVAGKIRVRYHLRVPDGHPTGYVQIYVDGVATSSACTATDYAGEDCSKDIYITAGEKIQFYAKHSEPLLTDLTNCRLYYIKTEKTDVLTSTDF